MPMGYETLVGDMGSSLSGGQRQRVIFARALFRKPKILVLDEATSHLDVDCERTINRCVDELDLTRILIAHRPETIAIANRVTLLARLGQRGNDAATRFADLSKQEGVFGRRGPLDRRVAD